MTGSTNRDRLAPLLLALQLSDSSFPSGMYTLSHGLEGLAQHGEVSADSLEETVHGILRHSVGPGESTALALAWRAAESQDALAPDPDGMCAALARIDHRLHATRLATQARVSAVRTGRQVLDLAAELVEDPAVDAWNAHVAARRSPGSASVVMGLVYARGGLGIDEAVATDLSAYLVSIAGAALRLRLTDHRGAQRLITRMAPVVSDIVASAVIRPIEELGGFAPALDIAQMRHETAPARLFAS